MSYSSFLEIKKENIENLSNIFSQNILSKENLPESLKSLSKDGDLPKELRPIAWKIFLGTLPNNSDIKDWIEKTHNQRAKYKKKLKKYFSIKKYKGDPLGGGGNSKKNERDYNTLHEENELRKIINLDIVRTYQNINLFVQENIKKLLLNIIFIWCKENEDVSYRQGMNELLAILILCFYPYYFPFQKEQKPTKEEIIKYIDLNKENKYNLLIYNYFHDEEEIESDLYYVFNSLMKKGMKNLFDPKVLQKNGDQYKLYELFPDIFKDDIEEEKSDYISRRCFLLINEKLKIIDEELFQYFRKLDINCGAFLQKWLRCIFAREFELDKVFILWDVILVQEYINENNQKYSLLFMDCICLSMLIRIRNKIFKRDQNDVFALLFKYPHFDDVKDIIILAYNIYQFINEKIKGKKIDPKIILNIAKSFKDKENENEKDDELLKNSHAIKGVYYTDKTKEMNKINNKNENNNYQEYNIKNNFLENKNNNINSNSSKFNYIRDYQANNFLNDAISSLGKFGNKLKDQLKIAKEAVLGLEDDDIQNKDINNKKENKMSDLFDIPNFKEEKEKNKNNLNDNVNNNINNNINEIKKDVINEMNMDDKKDISNIIKRLQKIDNKYNKYFEEEDKKEIENIINELLK